MDPKDGDETRDSPDMLFLRQRREKKFEETVPESRRNKDGTGDAK